MPMPFARAVSNSASCESVNKQMRYFHGHNGFPTPNPPPTTMKTTTYTGIDYAAGTGTNTDKDTGIRYGVISQNSLMAEALDDIYTHGRDLSHEQAEADLKSALRRTLEDYFHGERLNHAVDNAFDAIDGWADNFDGSGPYYYEADETVQTMENGELWVFKSLYFTHAQFCSPCMPGAGNLDTHCPDGPRTYCLGHDWFDGGKAPYPVYSVATGELIQPNS